MGRSRVSRRFGRRRGCWRLLSDVWLDAGRVVAGGRVLSELTSEQYGREEQ